MISNCPPLLVFIPSDTILGDAPELPHMEEVGDHHNARDDDSLYYLRLLGL